MITDIKKAHKYLKNNGCFDIDVNIQRGFRFSGSERHWNYYTPYKAELILTFSAHRILEINVLIEVFSNWKVKKVNVEQAYISKSAATYLHRVVYYSSPEKEGAEGK